MSYRATSRAGADVARSFERWRAATLGPFKQRVFLAFWCATLVSSFGSLIQTVGASWLMTTIAPSANRVALVQTAGSLPYFFLSLLAGALADTRARRLSRPMAMSATLLAPVGLASKGLLA